MELRHLRYFAVLADELHFGRAAERLHIVQPGLSKQIAALEAEIGVRLFDRDRRQVVLTHAGSVLHREARKILRDVERAVESTQQAARGEVGELDIGYVEPAMWTLLPAVLTVHRERFPDVRFRLWQESSVELVRRLLDHSLDVAFVRMPLHERELEFHAVAHDEFVVTLPVDHRLAGMEEVELSELAEDGFVLTPRSVEPGYFEQAMALCRSHGFTPKIVEEGDGPGSVLGMVAEGLGVALSPASIAQVPWRGVTFRPIAGAHDRIKLELACSFRRGDDGPGLKAFAATVGAVAAAVAVR